MLLDLAFAASDVYLLYIVVSMHPSYECPYNDGSLDILVGGVGRDTVRTRSTYRCEREEPLAGAHINARSYLQIEAYCCVYLHLSSFRSTLVHCPELMHVFRKVISDIDVPASAAGLLPFWF